VDQPRRGLVTSLGPPMLEPPPDFPERTLDFWQPRSSQKLTAEDAREMTANVSGFFRLLAAWDRERQQEEQTRPGNQAEK
jgi:hypothetical protein